MTAVSAPNLTLKEVHRLFGFQKQYDGSFSDLLSLETLTEPEKQELLKIRDDFEPYLAEGQALEGQIRIVVVAPLLRLAGFCFYNYPIQIKVENNIAPLDIQDEDISITGRSDIIAINKDKQTTTNWEIVRTLLERDRIRDQAEKAFRTAYPNAPERMINTAVFHIYIDGIQAALDWLVDVE